jgi:glycosyltransferase involved in cell wall biosynthesis
MRSGVSLVITVKNERRSLKRFLRTVYSQSRPPDEVIVVDGGSSDGTLQLLREEVTGQTEGLAVIEAQGVNIAAGRNIGIERARFSIVAVTDAGTELEPHWLERLVAPLERDAGTAVSSGFFTPGGRTWFERTLSTIITPQRDDIDPSTFLPSSRSVAFRKDWWRRVAGYPEWLDHCEDLVFDLALRDAGARFVFCPDAVVSWTARSSLPAFFRQYFLYARGDGHALLWSRRHAARYAAYGLGLGLAVLAPRRRLVLVPLVGGGAMHLKPHATRLLRHPPHSSIVANALTFVALPILVVTGDLAKMLGYPLGRIQRATGHVTAPADGPADTERRVRQPPRFNSDLMVSG